MNDAELLFQYAEDHSEEAFAELVRRHLNLVYRAALRQSGGDATRAEETVQAVFTLLARKAASLRRHTSLTGWLYTTVHHTVSEMRRSERRRRTREQEAQIMHDLSANDAPGTNWERVLPVLDELMLELNGKDREAILLRFFEGRPFVEVGAKLSLHEDAARMRVSRGLDRLRALLGKRGINSTAGALAAMLTNEAGMAAPAGLAATVSGAALATGGVSAVGVFKILQIMNLTKLGIGAAALLCALGVGTAVERHLKQNDHVVAKLTQENARLRSLLNAATERETVLKARTIPKGAGVKLTSLEDHIRNRTLEASQSSGPAGTTAEAHYHNAGQTRPRAALETLAWASDRADTDSLAKLIVFGGDGRAMAEGILAGLPEGVKAQYPTPEALFALFMADDALSYPPPPEDLINAASEQFTDPDHAALVFPNQKGMNFQNTPDGWKLIIPAAGVQALAGQILSDSPEQSPAPTVKK